MDTPSTIRGVSVRAIIALLIVGLSFAYFFAVTLLVAIFDVNETAMQLILLIVGLLGTAVGSATGFYFGQKIMERPNDGS